MEQAGGKTADLLRRGVDAAKAKRKSEAYQLLSEAVLADPGSEQGWLWLAAVAPTAEESRAAFERVLMINPANEKAQVGRTWAQSRIKGAPPQQPSPLAAAASAAPPANNAPPAPATAAAPTAPAPTQPEQNAVADPQQSEPIVSAPTPPVDNPPRRARGTNVLNPDVLGDNNDNQANDEPSLPTWLTNLTTQSEAPVTPATPSAAPANNPATTRRAPGTAPLQPPAGDPWEEAPTATRETNERSRAVTPGSDLTSENYPAVLAPTPRVPVRPASVTPPETHANMPDEEPAQQVVSEASAADNAPLSNPLTIAPTSAVNASIVTPPSAEPEASGLDAILPRRGAPGWVETDEDSDNVVPPPRVKPPVAAPATPPAVAVPAEAPPVVVSEATTTQASAPASDQAARPSIAPVAVTSRGSIWPLVALIALVVVAIIVALLVFTRGAAGASPQDAAQSFFDAHFAGDKRDAALALTSGNLKTEYNNGPVLELSPYPASQKWQARVQPLQSDGDSKNAEVYVFIDPQGSQGQSTNPAYVAHLVYENGWKIDALKSQ